MSAETRLGAVDTETEGLHAADKIGKIERGKSASALLEVIVATTDGVETVLTRDDFAQRIESWNASLPDGMVAARVKDVVDLIEEFGEAFGLSLEPADSSDTETIEPNQKAQFIAQSAWSIVAQSDLAAQQKPFSEIIKNKQVAQQIATIFIEQAVNDIYCSTEAVWDALVADHKLINTPDNKAVFLDKFNPAAIRKIQTDAQKRVAERGKRRSKKR